MSKHLVNLSNWIIILFSLLGLWISNFLLDIHDYGSYQAMEDSLLMGLCTGATEEDQDERSFDCRQVVLDLEWGYLSLPFPFWSKDNDTDSIDDSSETGRLAWGEIKVPLALVCQFYYFFLLSWFLFIGRPRPLSRRWHLLPLAGSAGTVAAAIFYIGVMAFLTDAWCLLCLILHAVNILVFFICLLLWRDAKTEKVSSLPLSKLHVAAALAYACTLCAISVVHRNGQVTVDSMNRRLASFQHQYELISEDADFLVNAYLGAPPIQIPERESQSSFGNLEAKNELVIFSDLQCPHCRKFERRFLTEYLPMWNGSIKMTFRHFPLCSDCNKTQKKVDAFPGGVHPQSCIAAYALEAAQIQGGLESSRKMYDLIHKNQDRLSEADFFPEILLKLAEEIGLDRQRLQKDLGSERVFQRIEEDVTLGESLQITVTPTLFLNGRRLTPVQWGSETFWNRIADSLAE